MSLTGQSYCVPLGYNLMMKYLSLPLAISLQQEDVGYGGNTIS